MKRYGRWLLLFCVTVTVAWPAVRAWADTCGCSERKSPAITAPATLLAGAFFTDPAPEKKTLCEAGDSEPDALATVSRNTLTHDLAAGGEVGTVAAHVCSVTLEHPLSCGPPSA